MVKITRLVSKVKFFFSIFLIKFLVQKYVIDQNDAQFDGHSFIFPIKGKLLYKIYNFIFKNPVNLDSD